MIEIFHEFLDQLYWIGYANQLLEHDLERYNWELVEFLKLYE